MSHQKERTDKNCLNCNAQVYGTYCSVCGQENIEPKESFWQLITHFIYDLFHYDGKFFATLNRLLFKPGVLTFDYVRGKRASYLHPIRMYVFTSAVFFIIFVSFIVGDDLTRKEDSTQFTSTQHGAIKKTIDQLQDSIKKAKNIDQQKNIQNEIDALKKVPSFFSQNLNNNYNDTTGDDDNGILVFGKMPATLDAYKLQQSKLTPEKKDGWLSRAFTLKVIEVNEKYKYDEKGFGNSLLQHFLHSLPAMMFVSLPVIALLFNLLYIRRRKQFSYVQHGVFAVHIYSAIYILILVVYALQLLNRYVPWGIIYWLIVAGNVSIFYYVYKAMRNFYDQGRWKTFFKFILLLFSYSFILVMLMAIFFLTSLIQV